MEIQPDKQNIDQMDTVLAQALGLSESQLDFIINYGIKYRMGQGASDDD
ncbi:MAG: hypothetical protein HOO85_03725 [Methylotenera sp.]|nr:hypothetical protein [Methylotenera sp.]